MATLSKSKGCQTCKDRRMKCDRNSPICNNCRRSRRNCAREPISWPKKPDQRRLIVGPPLRQSFHNSRFAKAHFLNISAWHMEAYRALQDTTSFNLIDYSTTPQLGQIPVHPSSFPSILRTIQDGTESLSYFYTVISQTLPNFDGSTLRFRDLLMRLALSDDGPSSQAVLYSLLSLSSLHRYSPSKAIELKSSALNSLQRSASKKNFTEEKTIQHIAAAIILCRVETSLASNATTLWCLFLCGINTLLNSTYQDTQRPEQDTDIRLLYQNIHYYMGMSSFSLLHWKHPSLLQQDLQIGFKGRPDNFSCKKLFNSTHFKSSVPEEVQLLTDAINVAKLFDQSGYNSDSYKNELDMLEDRISTAYMNATKDIRALLREPHDDYETRLSIQKRLFIGATWVYFIRMDRHVSGPSAVITSILGDAFNDRTTGIDTLDKCNLPFAIFILGIEAATEGRRRSVLDLIDRTVNDTPSTTHNHLGHITNMLETMWILDDLHVGNDGGRYLDYRHKLELVFTASEVLPALA